jgi:hypothetical protein
MACCNVCLSVTLPKVIQHSEFSKAIPSIVLWERASCFKISNISQYVYLFFLSHNSHKSRYLWKDMHLHSMTSGFLFSSATIKTAMVCVLFFLCNTRKLPLSRKTDTTPTNEGECAVPKNYFVLQLFCLAFPLAFYKISTLK